MRRWSDSPDDDAAQKTLFDDTIEAPSEAAMKAREEAKAAEGNGNDSTVAAALETAEKEMEERMGDDDSWMNGSGVVGSARDSKQARQRKGGKRK